MPKQTDPEIERDSELTRDALAALRTTAVDADNERYTDAICKRVYVALPSMHVHNVRRIYEKVCDREKPSVTVLNLRHQLQLRLAQHHKLKELRSTEIPGPATAATPAGRKP